MTTFLNDGLELLLRLWSEHCGTGLQVIHDDRGGVEIRVREVMRSEVVRGEGDRVRGWECDEVSGVVR